MGVRVGALTAWEAVFVTKMELSFDDVKRILLGRAGRFFIDEPGNLCSNARSPEAMTISHHMGWDGVR